MNRDDIQKLLGGYATGTLTPEEQQALFAAALDDQELFDALAREQSLRDLLRDPAAKAHLLTALDRIPARWWASWWRPAAVATAMTAVAVLAVIVFRNGAPTPKPVIVAVTKATLPESAAQAPPAKELEERRSKEAMNSKGRESDAVARRRDTPLAPPPPALTAPATQPAAEPAGALAQPRIGGARENAGGAVGGLAGGAPGAAPLRSTPAAPPKAESVAVKDDSFAAAMEASSVDQKRVMPGARMLFFGQGLSVEQLKSGFADVRQQQAQVKQAPAPEAQQQKFQVQSANQQAAAGKMVLPSPAQLGVRYSVAKTGERVELLLETNTSGFLAISARKGSQESRPPQFIPVESMKPQAFTLLSGEDEVFVWFSRQAQPLNRLAADLFSQPATNLIEKDGLMTYVVNPVSGPAGQQVRFTIRLP